MRAPLLTAVLWLLAVQWLAAVEARAQDASVGGKPGSARYAGEPAGFPFSDAAHRNAVLHSGLDSIQVRFGDGRRDMVVRVVQRPEGAYIPLPDLGRISGGGFKWNPEMWRGSVWIDSTEVILVLDTQVFWVQGTPVQLPAPVRYALEQVWIPVGFLEGILLPLMGGRAIWDPIRGVLSIQARGSFLRPISVTEGAGTAALAFQPVGDDSLRLRWDPVGLLHVEIHGASLPLDFAPPPDLPEGIRLARYHRLPSGTEFVFDVEPSWLGVQRERDRGGAEFVRLTGRSRDITHGPFEPLGYYLHAGAASVRTGAAGKTVVIEMPAEARQEAGRARCLETVARTLAHTLQTGFGHEVILQRDRGERGLFHSPAGTPEIPPCPPADVWIGFRLDQWPGSGVRELLLVAPSSPPLGIPPGAEAGPVASAGGTAGEYRDAELLAGRIVPWGQTARLHQNASMLLARTLSEHMGHEWEGRPVRIACHPARVFRGLDMPAVIISPGLVDDVQTLDLICEYEALQRLVRNLAFGVDEFLTVSSGRR